MKVLVYQIGQLGDTIVSIPALRALHHYLGQKALIMMMHDVIQRLVTSEMALEGTALIDEFIPYSPEKSVRKKLLTMATLWRRIRNEHFDMVVSLLPSDRPRWSLLRDRAFFRSCGIRQFVGFRPYTAAEIQPRGLSGRPARTPHEAILRLRRLFADGIVESHDLFAEPLLTVSREHQQAIDSWLAVRRKHPGRPLIALCPGCKKAGNAWPKERFLEIARRLRSLEAFEIVIAGGPAERDLANYLTAGLAGQAISAAGCFSVAESAALFSRCDLLIGLDTGTSHLAAAVGVPCVVIQSANSFPGQWDPLGASHSVIRADVPCAACLHQVCPVAGHPCMQNISVDTVWQPIEAFISSHEHHANHPYV